MTEDDVKSHMVTLFLYIKKVLKFEPPIFLFLNFVQIPKTMNRSVLFTLLMCLLTSTFLSAQTPVANLPLPRVFQLGGNEQAYETLSKEYGQSLLEVCNNDMKIAFEKWLEMMKALEDYAKKINFDIKGVKVRLHVFWNADGSIDHIGYVLRTNSRNIRSEEFSAFLSSFTRQYTFSLKSQQKFSHYTIATFPLHTEKAG